MTRLLSIATATSRNAKRWHNQEITWSAFCASQMRPVRTKETLAEYRRMPKSEQGAVKDVGGFVGGYLRDGSRKRGHCEHRSLVTFDADSPCADFLDRLALLLDEAYCVFSTHSHTDTSPRYRLVIPLSRNATPDEYVPLALKIAETLGLDNFDRTTYQAERLMYNSSCPADAPFVWRESEGDWLDVDAWLGKYRDWTDASSWPLSDINAPSEAKKLGDPLEKPGLVGLFNRTFDIHAAISGFLGDTYTDAGGERYTYSHGSTAGGLVVYDGVFAYSNHATDPAGGRLLNAYDLVRVHRFGAMDTEADPGCPVNKLPSSTAMRQWVSELPAIAETVASEKREAAAADFGQEVALDISTEWQRDLDITKQGELVPSAKNIEAIMLNDPALVGLVQLDTFAKRATLTRNAPWREITPQTAFWSDTDDAGLRVYVEKVYGIASRQRIEDALTMENERNAVHPVRDYLASLEWDGIKRCDTLLVDYLGAEDNVYVRDATRKWLVAAVARVMRPGIKFDHMLVLVGDQGLSKSELFSRLGGKWYSDTLHGIGTKEAYEGLAGTWVMELPEMTATKKADVSAVKQFITKREDRFREAYGRRLSYHARQCVFAGTVNEGQFLRDQTGNRRFWPVVVDGSSELTPWDLDRETVGQIWAEAASLFEAGEVLMLTGEAERIAASEQAVHTETGALDGLVSAYLAIPITEDWYERSLGDRKRYITQFGEALAEEAGEVERDKVCVMEVWCEALGNKVGSLKPINASEIMQTLNNLDGWRKHRGGDQGRLRFGRVYDRQAAWVRCGSVLDA